MGARGESLRYIEVARESTLIRSSFGLLEPSDGEEIDPLDLDVIVTPLVAFDSFGSRIGMGGGSRPQICIAGTLPELGTSEAARACVQLPETTENKGKFVGYLPLEDHYRTQLRWR